MNLYAAFCGEHGLALHFTVAEKSFCRMCNYEVGFGRDKRKNKVPQTNVSGQEQLVHHGTPSQRPPGGSLHGVQESSSRTSPREKTKEDR